jgi:hypothetical protein
MDETTTIPKSKFKKFLTENKVIARDLEAFTIKVDPDKYGIKINHIYLIGNGHISPNVNTMIILCRALSVMLNKKVTPNDLIDY